ncbi:hypothetical protein BGZ67_007672 [Mortierella alpina]|nr:hypothetical protein BGZ67_007672 [Mortierella alpina]
MDPPHPHISSVDAVGSYFDLVKPISIPNTAVFHHNPDFDDDVGDEEGTLNDTLPEYLQSFHGSGISDARLKRFNWLHPKNYSGEGSLSDDYTLSPYGTSVSSPRGEEWEIVDRGPRKSIDELWDEVFEYQERIKLLEQVQEAQARAQWLGDQEETAEMSCSSSLLSCSDELQPSCTITTAATGTTATTARAGGAAPWAEYGGCSETCCYTPTLVLDMTASFATGRCEDAEGGGATRRTSWAISATLGQTPITAASSSGTPRSSSAGTMTQIDKAIIYASRKGVRSDRGAALRLLQVVAFGGSSPR